MRKFLIGLALSAALIVPAIAQDGGACDSTQQTQIEQQAKDLGITGKTLNQTEALVIESAIAEHDDTPMPKGVDVVEVYPVPTPTGEVIVAVFEFSKGCAVTAAQIPLEAYQAIMKGEEAHG